MATVPAMILLKLRLRQGRYALNSLPWYYWLLLLPACLLMLAGLFKAAIISLPIWAAIAALPWGLHLIRRDHYHVLRRLQQPEWALFWESSPIWLFAAVAGLFHHPGLVLVPLMLAAFTNYLPVPNYRRTGAFLLSIPTFLQPWFNREGRSIWRTQSPWIILLMLATIPALMVPALSLWLTALITLIWSGSLLRSESWLELRSSGRKGYSFLFQQFFHHSLPLGAWTLLIALLHGYLQPELAWLSLVLPLIQGLFLLLMWSIRYTYWRPSEVSAGQMAASIAAIGLIIPVIAPVIPFMLVYYLPRALFRLHHELLP